MLRLFQYHGFASYSRRLPDDRRSTVADIVLKHKRLTFSFGTAAMIGFVILTICASTLKHSLDTLALTKRSIALLAPVTDLVLKFCFLVVMCQYGFHFMRLEEWLEM